MGVPISMSATHDSICQHQQMHRFSAAQSIWISAEYIFYPWLFLNSLRNLLIKAGINPVGYNGHSFRKGAAHSAAAAGMSDQENQNTREVEK